MANDTAVVSVEQQRAELEAKRDAHTVEDKLLSLDLIRDVGTLDGGALQRWVVRVPLYPRHLYIIPGPRRKLGSGWVGEYSTGVRAEGYDKLNKVAGIRFFTPATVHDREGREVPNPIHARDYLYHREIGQGYSETGQMVLYVEDIEIDYRQAWEQERLKKLDKLLRQKSKGDGGQAPPWESMSEEAPASGAEKRPQQPPPPDDHYVIRDESGMPKLAANGGLMFRLPEKAEVEAMQRISQLRVYGGRQARTIARRRIFQQAFALRSLSTVEAKERPELETRWVWVTGWRDMLTADEALERAKSEFGEVFGSPIGTYADDKQVTTEELKATDESETVTDEVDAVVEGKVREVSPQAAPKAEAGEVLPGERMGKAVCGARDVVGPEPCSKPPDHCPTPHMSEDGVWPCDLSE